MSPPPDKRKDTVTCTCKMCGPPGRILSKRQWYRHNPGGKGLKRPALSLDDIDYIMNNFPAPKYSKRRKRSFKEEIEDLRAQISRRNAGSSSRVRKSVDTVDEHEAIRDIPLFTQPLAPPADSEYEVAPPARSDHENNDIDLEHPPSPPTIDNETGEKPLSRFAGPMATGLSPIRDEFTTDNQETPLEKSQPDEKKDYNKQATNFETDSD